MKKALIIFMLCISIAACQKKDNNGKAKFSEESIVSDDTLKESFKPVVDSTTTLQSGTHPITLQWIGWDKPGKAEVVPLTDGWYSINGSQSHQGQGHLKINGKIRRISEKELEFIGTVETLITTINGGKSCLKEGKQIFYAKGNRTYFRLQNMENCEGRNLLDYVDIFPGTSDL